MYPHRIRLRGPWECEPLQRHPPSSSPSDLPPVLRMVMPCRWADAGLAEFRGRVRFRRRFGYPGRIDAHERVWLTFAGVADRAEVWLNGERLGKLDGAFAYEVTPWLLERNELIVEVEGGVDGGLWGETALEVRCVAFLQDVHFVAAQEARAISLRAEGGVVASSEQSLELYMLLGRSTIAYQPIVVREGETPFRLEAQGLTFQQWEEAEGALQVDLVNGASVWYTLREQVVLATTSFG
jgi:hypothetical protein